MNQLELQPLELLDLSKCATVSDIVAGMSHCSFGARMLGETAATLTTWIATGRAPLCIYDGRSDTPLGQLLQSMIRRKWLLGLMTPGEYSRTIAPGGRLVVVGAFSERDEQALFERPEQAIYINSYDLAKPGQVRDGWYPDAVFSDPRFVMPVLNRVLEDRLGTTQAKPGKVADLIADLEKYGGLATEVAAGARTFKAMVEDKECFVFFTMSGAMTIAKMGLVICDMIDHGMVQALASTGALMAHGLVESVGLKHYKYDPAKGDAELAAARLNRVTDTLEPETNLDHIEGVLDDLLNGFEAGRPFSPVILNRMVGEHLAKKYPNDRGILKSAFLKNVPVMVPAFVDSEIGNDVHVHNRKRERDGRPLLTMDMELDTRLLVDLATTCKRAGIFTIGGGVPRNNVQNVAPLVEIMNERLGTSLQDCKFRYGCRICPDRMHYGHLSGCTYSEGMSWRKFDPAGMFAEVHADATQVWPFYVKYVLE